MRVALTGGIATGKSYCAARLTALGAPVIDADVLAHEAVAPGTPGLAAVVARFGAGVLRPDGSLNRPALAERVFADPKARTALEGIVHPVVHGRTQAWFAGLEAQASAPAVAVAVIPLLYETGRSADFDRVVVAACPADVQLARVMARDRLPVEDGRLRLAAQWPIADKVRRGDYVIDTSGTYEDTDRQVERIWKTLVDIIDPHALPTS
jgi:dephospho-CoA kinase